MPVDDAVLTLADGMINVTWTPPIVPNGIIYQYIVERVNSSGKFYHHVPADEHVILLPLLDDALIFVAAVNLYGKGISLHARSEGTVCMMIVYTLYIHALYYTRSTSNPMDKGVCNFVKSEIQTWLPCTIISNF